jgi:hypothetical protein
MTIRQRTSVNFDLPHEGFPTAAAPQTGERIFVPVSLADKDMPMVSFDLTDEAGNALSLLTASEGAHLAAVGLNSIVDALADERNVAGVKAGSQLEALTEIASAPSAERGRELLATHLASTAPLGQVLAEDDIYRALVEELAIGFLMLVPIAYEPDAHVILKWQSDGPDYGHRWKPATRGDRLFEGLLTAMASVGLADKRASFRNLSVGWAQSTHFEFEPPEGVNLGRARLRCEQWDPKTKQNVSPEAQVFHAQPAVDLRTTPRCEFNRNDPDSTKRKTALENMLKARSDTGRMTLRMRAATSTVIIPSVLASTATCIALWFAQSRLTELDGQTSAALLLLFPATVAAFLARSGEHGFVTHLLQGVRWSSAVVIACALVTVGVIGGGLVADESDVPRQTKAHCDAQTVPVGPKPRSPSRLTALDCTEQAVPADPPPPDRDAKLAVTIAASIASLFTAGPLLGMVLSLQVDLVRRRAGKSRYGS